MCEWGTTEVMELTIPAHLSHTGIERRKLVDIDSCIVPVVAALNQGGVATVASCCGHGKRPGSIVLADGREIIIAPDYETGRAVDRAFPALFDQGQADALEPGSTVNILYPVVIILIWSMNLHGFFNKFFGC